VSVNVIEHLDDPVGFLESLRRALAPGGRILVVCPDGTRAGVELLIADHLSSFLAAHLRALFGRAGLEVVTWQSAPEQLGEFQMIEGRAGSDASPEPIWDAPLEINARRHSFLESWARLDAHLAARLPPDVVCFGTGEAAALLRAYAPESWTRVRACTADGVRPGSFGDIPVIPLSDVPANSALLTAVRPRVQPAVAERLRRTFASVTTWYDLVEEHRGE
jgi:hypothetical protein